MIPCHRVLEHSMFSVRTDILYFLFKKMIEDLEYLEEKSMKCLVKRKKEIVLQIHVKLK
jgi:hypothetical protein